MPEVGCYSMELYCDHASSEHHYDEFPHTFTGRTNAECKRKAKRAGWFWHSNGMIACPKCKGRKQPESSACGWG